MLDRPVVKRRELGTRELDHLQAIGRQDRLWLDHTIDLEGNRAGTLGVEVDADHWPIEVSFAITDFVRVLVDSGHRLNGVAARRELGERTGKAVGQGAQAQ